MYVWVCMSPIRLGLPSTLTANQIAETKCVSSEETLESSSSGAICVRPRTLNTALLQLTNIAFVSLLKTSARSYLEKNV